MSNLHVSPEFSSLIPPLTDIEYRQLFEDIAEHGIVVPIETNESGTIIDGHHRFQAWTELRRQGADIPDIPIITRTGMSQAELIDHARRINLFRRHLTKEQRDEQIKTMRGEGKSTRQIAEAVGVNQSTVVRTLQDIKPPPDANASPERITGKDGKSYPPVQPVTKNKDSLFTSNTSEWYTPQIIIEATLAVLNEIDLDPCSNEDRTIPALQHYTIHEDGLSQSWLGKVYMNPPYGQNIAEWTEKCKEEYLSGGVEEAILLLPSRTDTVWFSSLKEFPKCFIRGRLTFQGAANSAPFPSVAVYMGEDPEQFYVVFGGLGDCYEYAGS